MINDTDVGVLLICFQYRRSTNDQDTDVVSTKIGSQRLGQPTRPSRDLADVVIIDA
jgi:hypothetical protein